PTHLRTYAPTHLRPHVPCPATPFPTSRISPAASSTPPKSARPASHRRPVPPRSRWCRRRTADGGPSRRGASQAATTDLRFRTNMACPLLSIRGYLPPGVLLHRACRRHVRTNSIG